MTQQVTKPVENAIAGVPRLEQMHSTSSNSISLVVAQFGYGTDVKATTQAIQDAITKAKLPATASPTVQALNINSSPVVIASIAATGTSGLDQVGNIAQTEIVPEIQGIEGVARADLTGGLEQRVFITLDPAKLAAASITAQQIVGVLQANNLTVPSGQLPADGSSVPVSTIGTFTSVEQVRDLVVGFQRAPTPGSGGATAAPAAPAGGATASQAPAGSAAISSPAAAASAAASSPAPVASGAIGSPAPAASGAIASPPATAAPVTPVLPKPITIGQLGTVESKAVATTGFGRTNGDQALTITVSKASNANTVDVADAVQAKLAEIGQRHADQLTITTVADQSVFIKELANGLLREGGLGAVFAILTIFLFLFSLRATVVAAVSIPLSILRRS